MRITDEFIIFNERKDWPGLFYGSSFTWPINSIRSNTFSSADQAFLLAESIEMEETRFKSLIVKSIDFPSFNSIDKIICDSQINNRVEKLKKWNSVKCSTMESINFAKFTQNKDLLDKIRDPLLGDRSFVCASSQDLIWSCGICEDDDLILDSKQWRGENLLGKILDNIRKFACKI